jgi:4-aminobutyrate aminotransferase-like enzyme
MDLYPPGSMTSTHTGNPCARRAPLANLRVIQSEKLVANAKKTGDLLRRSSPPRQAFRRTSRRHARQGPRRRRANHQARQDERAGRRATWNIVRGCVERGLMLFSPVGPGGGSVKICPPLSISEDAMREGIAVLEESMAEVL